MKEWLRRMRRAAGFISAALIVALSVLPAGESRAEQAFPPLGTAGAEQAAAGTASANPSGSLSGTAPANPSGSLSGTVPANQPVQLPGSPWVISLPDEMKYSGPRDGDGTCVFAYWLPGEAAGSVRMEIDFFIYASEGMNLAAAAEAMATAGMDVELRDVNGIEMICGVSTDPADGAPCVSYGMLSGENIVEVVFWCADQEAADLSKVIMETIRRI